MKAAESGHMDSMGNCYDILTRSIVVLAGTLGLLYLKGQGCKEDKELSLKWLKKSAENGSIYGTGLLCNYYYSMKMYSKAVDVARR